MIYYDWNICENMLSVRENIKELLSEDQFYDGAMN